MRKKELYYHIAGWSLYLLYTIVGEFFVNTGSKFPLYNYSMFFVKLLEFYVFYLWVYPNYLNKGKIPQLIGGIVAGLFSFIICRYLVEEVLFLYVFGHHNYYPGTTVSYYILDNLYFSTSAAVLSAAVYSSFDALRKEHENKSLREEKIQAELAFLKTQINPHFLYNTLNYIYSLAYPVSPQLANAVIKLSQLMRYMLTESANGTVDLQKEVEYIENYISIYQMRFENSFFVDFDTEGNIAGKRIACLLLVPFVENAFKHGLVNDPAQPIEILLKVQGDQLVFKVSNQVNMHQQKDLSTGIGLPNIKRRLELIYPGKHKLNIVETGESYQAVLILEL